MAEDEPPIPGMPEPEPEPGEEPETGPPGTLHGNPRENARSRIASLNLQVRQLRTLVEEMRGEHQEMRDAIARLTRLHDHAPPPFYPPDLPDEERARFDADLREWVADILSVEFANVGALIKPCWWEHRNIRAHLHAAWLAWLGAYRHPARRNSDPDAWVRVSLPALRSALASEFGDVWDECGRVSPNGVPHSQMTAAA